jgi:hypothetical protein
VSLERGKPGHGVESINRQMDAYGARLLAARIRAGVRLGDEIELVGDPGETGLARGDRGHVDAITDDGNVVVIWERGFSQEIDPVATPIRAVRAA